MKTSAFACTAVLALATACFHAKEVADPSQEERASQQGSEEEKSAKEEAGTDGKDSENADAPSEKGPPSEKKASAKPEPSANRAASDEKGDGKQGEDAIDPEDIPVASSPHGLLKPGADEKVREKLGVPKQGGMRKELMNFQREHDLPATGMLDHETVEKLGLDPKDIFQKEG